MDVLSVLRLLTRHWRVTAPAALITVLMIGVAFKSSSPTYEATGSIVLLPPPEAPDVNSPSGTAPPPSVGQNPFARYGDLSVVADILARVMDSDSRRAEFESQGVAGYDVVVNRFQRGPVVDVTGQGPTGEAAIRSTEIVLNDVNAVLSELQQAEDADPDYFIHGAGLEPPSTATAMYGSTVRTAIAALAVGALGTLGLAVLAEVITRRREASPTAVSDTATSDAASLGTDTDTNGSRNTGPSGILPRLNLMRGAPPQQEPAQEEPSKPEPERHERSKQEPELHEPKPPAWSKLESAPRKAAQRERSKLDSAPRKAAQHERSKQESAWQKAARTFQQELSSESPADNGHGRPTTDRSP